MSKRPHELGTWLFLIISAFVPVVNVDLLIQRRNSQGTRETLLVWREDRWYRGWHLAGGVIRFKESGEDRVKRVAWQELGAKVLVAKEPVLVSEKMAKRRRLRGHFVSLLYECDLTTQPLEALEFVSGAPLPGQWQWHEMPPRKLIPQHRSYRPFF